MANRETCWFDGPFLMFSASGLRLPVSFKLQIIDVSFNSIKQLIAAIPTFILADNRTAISS